LRTAAVLVVAAAAAPLTAQVHPTGPPVAVEWPGVVAPHTDGGFLVVSSEYSPASPEDEDPYDTELYVRRYSTAGVAGPRHQINLQSDDSQVPGDVLALPGGDYLVVWSTQGTDTPAANAATAALDGTALGTISARYLDAAGMPVGPEIALDGGGSYAEGVDAALLTSGELAAGWYTRDAIMARRFDLQGGPVGPPIVVHERSGEVVLGGDVAPLPGGGFVVAFKESHGVTGAVYARRYDGVGAPLGPALVVSQERSVLFPAIAANAAGGFVIGWDRFVGPPGPFTRAAARRIGPDGEPQGDVFDIDAWEPGNTRIAGLSMEPDGRFVLAWTRDAGGDSSAAMVALFTAGGSPVEPPLSLGGPGPGAASGGLIVRRGSGEWLTSWTRQSPSYAAYVQRLGLGCGAATELCLHGARFRVEAEWELPGGGAGAGQAVPLTDDSGAFWFFGQENLELMVKVLDGRAVNGHFWVFFGSLSDVEYTLTVTDTATGARRSYTNPAGTLASRADTQAFPAPLGAGAAVPAALARPPTAAPAAAGLTPGPLVPLPTGGVLTATPGGGFIVADWGLPLFPGDGVEPEYDVFVRVYSATGAAGPARQVNLRTEGVQTPQRVVALRGGGYVVVWVTEELYFPDGAAAATTGSAPAPGEIAARLLDADGVPVGPEILVNAEETFGWPEGAAALPGGGFVVTWQTGDALFSRRFDAQGEPLEPPILVGSGPLTGGWAAALPDGGFVVAFIDLPGKIFTRRYDGAGAPRGPALLVSSGPAATRPVVASDASGGFIVVWTHIDRPPAGNSYDQWVMAQRFGQDGEPLGGAFVVDRPPQRNALLADLDMEPGGRFVVAWNRVRADLDPSDRQALVGLFGPGGAPEGAPLELGAELLGSEAVAEVHPYGAGSWLAIWHRVSPLFARYGQRLETGCGGGADLCLHDDRFHVEVAWELPGGDAGAGQALPLTDDSGAFWFFGPSNLELLVKVLDGRAVNGHFWVFFGALSDVAYTVTVTDTATGATRSYTNPAGTMASQADTQAF
jgi:hypothetical protein